MAGKTLTAIEKIGLQLTCPIHLESFVDPRLLACHHVFCRKCLYELADNGTKSAIICPTCRHITRLPQDGVAGLPAAFDVIWLFELRETLLKEQKGAAADNEMLCFQESSSKSSSLRSSNSSIDESSTAPPPVPPRGAMTPPPPRGTITPPPRSTTPSSSTISNKDSDDLANLKMENWYIECSREEAKQLLIGRQDGTFIIRPAGKVSVESEGVVHTHTIDIINKRKLCHIKILLFNGKYGLARGSCMHDTLSKLVQYYSRTSLQCHNSVIITPLSVPAFALCI